MERGLFRMWEVCQPRDGVAAGRLDYSKFAMKLWAVLEETAEKIYKESELCFEYTHLTSGMRFILQEVLLRPVRGSRRPCIVIDTAFGGGKTHTLIKLYHLFRDPATGLRFLSRHSIDNELSITDAQDVKMVAIDYNGVRSKTLWGELAKELGHYEEIRVYDEERRLSTDIGLFLSMARNLTLILVDELPRYVLRAGAERVGNTTLAELMLGFVQMLISAVSQTERSMLILTLTDDQPPSKGGDDVYWTFPS